jgi:hypothetical protein
MATEREETDQQARPDWEEYVKPNLVIYCESKEGILLPVYSIDVHLDKLGQTYKKPPRFAMRWAGHWSQSYIVPWGVFLAMPQFS